MATITLTARPLTANAFAPFGDLIQADSAKHFAINGGSIERYHDLAQIDLGLDLETDKEPGLAPDPGREAKARPIISLATCNRVTRLPYQVPLLERHPLGSQAFIPLDDRPLFLVVAPTGDQIDPTRLCAFVSSGRQGINYRRGVWHMPLIALEPSQRWLIVDRAGPGDNCEERAFTDDRIILSS